MRGHWKGIAAGVVLVFLASGFASAGAIGGTQVSHPTSTSRLGPMITTVAGNWASYYVYTATLHKITSVRGSWIVPALKASCKSHPASGAFFGIGMDDVSSSATSFENIGTTATCSSSGRHYGVVESFDTTSFALGGPVALKVSPGNVISAEIKFLSGKLYYSLTNHNTSGSYHHAYSSANSKFANRDTAEWFSTTLTGFVYLAPYGTAQFGPKYTHLNHTDEVNISGTTKAIGSHTNLVASNEFRGSLLLAVPGALAGDRESFVVTWKNA